MSETIEAELFRLRDENARLKVENKELLAWKTGQKGVEEYYSLMSEHQEMRSRLFVAERMLAEAHYEPR